MEAVMGHPGMAEMKRFVQATADAHEFYREFGFEPLEKPERWMMRSGSVLRPSGYEPELIPLLADPDRDGELVPILFDRVEDESLTLAQEAKDGSLESAGPQVDLGAIVVADDDPGTGDRVVGLDHTLKHGQAFSILPARMHDVQTRARRVFDPWRILTRWMLGSQRRLLRLWEKLTVLP